MKHVIVTGGSGFLGSHLCEKLLLRGYAVSAVDNFVTGRKENVESLKDHPHFQLIEWDVSEELPASKVPMLQRWGLYGLLHFACPASPVDFDKIPFEILKVDSIGTMHTVELAHRYQARYLIASTSEIYGDPLIHPQTEDYFGNVNTTGPRACYDEAKRFSEAYVSTAQRGYKGKPLNAALVRIFNTYGPRMRADDGRIVPELCVQALQGKPLTIHGDGKQTRSYCYVSDLIEGIVRLFESDVRLPVNIGNPEEYTVLEFSELARELTGSRSRLEYLPSRPDDPKRRCPDIRRAQKLLQWSPQVPLREGLRLTLEYFKKQI